MDFLNVPIILALSSFTGIVILLGILLYGIRNLGEEELREGAAACPPFFSEFSAGFSLVERIAAVPAKRGAKISAVLLKEAGIKSFSLVSRLAAGAGYCRCRVSNYFHGRHSFENNGCKGYWNELNETKNGSTGFTAGGNGNGKEKMPE